MFSFTRSRLRVEDSRSCPKTGRLRNPDGYESLLLGPDLHYEEVRNGSIPPCVSSGEYADSYRRDSRQCPICRLSGAELDGSQAAYLAHLAIEHEQVMKFVQAAVGKF